MKNCKDCAHSVFDERWGEYKCKVVQHVIHDVEKIVACKDYTPNKEEK